MKALAPWLTPQLRRLIAQPGHAWLLHGVSGLGQYVLAQALADAWLCEQPTPDGACGQCVSCRLLQARTHPDLAVLMPEDWMLEQGWPLSEKAQAEIDEKRRKPSREIRVEAMREAVDFSQLTSTRGGYKLVLIYPAERMNHVTANTLLKTLEEPPGAVRFILATEAVHQLLPTLRSRCQAHGMAWPTAQELQQWLSGDGRDVGPKWLKASGDRPMSAVRMAASQGDSKVWANLPQAMRGGDASLITAWHPRQTLDALQKLCYDLMALHWGGEPRFFDMQDLPTPVPGMRALSDWFQALTKAVSTVEHPYQAGLMNEWLSAQAAQALKSIP